MENKNERNENKIIPGDFTCTMDKMERYSGNKTQTLYRCCYYYALNVDDALQIYGKRRTQILLSSPAIRDLLTRIQDRQGL